MPTLPTNKRWSELPKEAPVGCISAGGALFFAFIWASKKIQKKNAKQEDPGRGMKTGRLRKYNYL
jgi:hypothetical protein